MVSVGIAKRINIKLEHFLLNTYSIKKYKTLYEESKTQVNKDIKLFSEKYQTTKVKDIKMLMMFELLDNKKDKQVLLELHQKEITKFD